MIHIYNTYNTQLHTYSMYIIKGKINEVPNTDTSTGKPNLISANILLLFRENLYI